MRFGAIPETIAERAALALGLAPTPFVETFHAALIARAIMVGVKLGVFEACAHQSRSSAELAGQLDVDARALAKLLNLLSTTGYLSLRDGRFTATRLARKWMVSGSSQSLRDNMLLRFLEWQAIEQMEDYVRLGKSLDVHTIIRGDQWTTYQLGMQSLSRITAAEVARRVHIHGGASEMLDIGGGHGAYSVAFCRRHPRLKATIVDLPAAVEAAAPILAREKMGDRITHRVGDAASDDFGTKSSDLVFISHLIHHFDQEANASLVRRAAAALRPGGTLAILDVMRPSSNGRSNGSGAILDLYFGLTSSAGTYAAEEIDAWVRDAGLRPRKVINLRMAPGVAIAVASRQ
jgi:SAM-dependent methyltransferase